MAFYLSGCNFISYETKPIANQQVIEKITAKDPEDPRFKEFLKIQGFKEDSLPIKEWGLNELMLCALFFNPRIEIAKKALKNEVKNPELGIKLAKAYQRTNNIAMAKKAIDSMLRKLPNNSDILKLKNDIQ